MERSSKNIYPSSSYGKFWAIFGSPDRYLTENCRWVPLLINVSWKATFIANDAAQIKIQSHQ